MKPRFPDLDEALGHDAADKRIDILRRIGEAGSISEAARAAGVSYKAAWQAIETLANLAGTPLVEKAVGGSGGGGARLTPAGARVLEAAALVARSRAEALARFERGRHPGEAPAMAAMALRTSMRNQFPCEVVRLSPAHGMIRVALRLGDDGRLCARITRESAQLLGLRRGLRVLALCKATAVRIAPELAPADAGNLLRGAVTRASRAQRGGEVALRLDCGPNLVGFVQPGIAMRAGGRAMAGIDESAVVLAAWA